METKSIQKTASTLPQTMTAEDIHKTTREVKKMTYKELIARKVALLQKRDALRDEVEYADGRPSQNAIVLSCLSAVDREIQRRAKHK